jgi:YVTN family beta-propeller protein
MFGRNLWLACCVAGLAICGCDSSNSSSGAGGSAGSGGTAGSGGSGGTGGETRLVVTADWLNQSLTLLDYDKLIDGESDGPSAVVDTIDLSDWEPGPIEVEVTPDGKTAVVSVGPAFFDESTINLLIGSPEVPPGGTLLIVDLESGEATEVLVSDVPLGIAISPDGTVAYTANYGTTEGSGNTLSIIDIAAREVIKEITVDGRPEQVALSPDGTLGVFNIAGGGGGVHIFETADPEGTMSPLVPTGNDPSDVTFLGDNTRVVAANSFGLDVALVDTSDPSAPFPIDNFPVEGGFLYPATYMPTRGQLLTPTATGANFVTIDIEGDTLIPSDPVVMPGGSFLLGAAVDSTDSFAFTAHVQDKKLSIIDLETGAMRAVTWLEEAGPTYVVVVP